MTICFQHSWVFGLVLAASSLAVSASANPGWQPHLEEDGEAKDLGDPKELKDKDWLAIRYSEYSGSKTRLGVVVSEEKNAYPPKYKSQFSKMIVALSGKPEKVAQPQNHIEDLVRQALMSTNRFNMMERTTATRNIVGEQAFGDSGRVDPSTAARIGGIKGAEYIVRATLIELNPEKETKEIKAAGGVKGGSGVGFGGVGLKSRVAFCRLNLRVIRTETGEIVSDQTVDGTAISTGLTGMGGVGVRLVGGVVGVKSKRPPPISDAMQACANKAAYYVATTLEETPWQGTVASVEGSQVTITGGTNAGLREGMTLSLLSKGADVVDPVTNEVIGSEASEFGQIRVVSAQEQFSTCEIIQGGDGAKKGDLVRRENPKR